MGAPFVTADGVPVSRFERLTHDGERVIVEMVGDRGSAWVVGGAFLGSSSARVLWLFVGEVCITDAGDLPRLLSDCRRAKGDVTALSALHRNRERRRNARPRQACVRRTRPYAWCGCGRCA